MDKALIEKAFEKWKNDSGCRNNSCNDCQGGCEGAFIAGATWQREQLDIQTTSIRNSDFDEWWKDFSKEHKHELDGGVLRIEYLLETAWKASKNSVIEEMRKWALRQEEEDLSQFLAKLDLLEKGGE